jgi:MFS family permease
MVNSINTRSKILWRQVWGLAVFWAAIIFSWITYVIYQPRILQQFDFVDLATWLGIVQGSVAAFIEPLMGEFSDRVQRRFGSRLPMISVGVMLAGFTFVAVSLLLQQSITEQMPWVIPVLMSVWAMAMIVFRAPTITLLRKFAPLTELPQANAALVLVFGLIGTIRPQLELWLKSIGPSVALLLSAIALLVGGFILRTFATTLTFESQHSHHNIPSAVLKLSLILIFTIGLSTGLEVNLLLSVFPGELRKLLPNLQVEWITSGMLLISAIASFPLAELTAKIGASQGMLFGLGSITALMGVTILNDSEGLTVLLILGFGVGFSLICLSMIPLVLSMLPTTKAGLGTGLYFGGGGFGTTLVSIFMKQPGIISVGAFLLAEAAFLVVVWCIFMGKKKSII